MEEIRAAHQRETAALTEACRRAEQVKRDAVGRLMPVQSREADMTEELARMKEKDRLVIVLEILPCPHGHACVLIPSSRFEMRQIYDAFIMLTASRIQVGMRVCQTTTCQHLARSSKNSDAYAHIF
jgi:hypothetical protein